MGTFAVKVGDAEYEVDAKDEKQAWEFANAEHTKVKPYDIPAGLKSAMNVGQALTFGFGDEIAGSLGMDKGRYRKTLEEFKQEYPGSAALGSVSGSMLLPFGGAKLAAQAPYSTAAAIGGTQAALQAAGDAPTTNAAMKEAPAAGLLGMVAAPLMVGGIGASGNVLSGLAAKALPDWAKDVARRRVATAFDRDAVGAEDVGRRMVQIGSEARVADSAGENTRGLLDLQATLPGRTKDLTERTIRERQGSAFDRLNDSVVYTLSGGYGRAKDLTKALSDQQKSVSKPLYDEAYKADYTPSPSAIRDLEAARKLGAFGEAQKRSLANPEDGPFTLDAAQQVLGGGKISLRDMDRIKQGIDGLIEKETDTVTGKVTGYGRDLVSLKKRLVSEVDAAVPSYKAARQAFAGPAELKTAVEKGKKFWRDEPAKLEDEIAGMTTSEQEAFRVGAAEALRFKVGGERGRSELMNMWKDNNIKERMKAILGDDVKYSDVSNMINNEAVLSRLYKVGRGSQTASRLAMNEDEGLGVAADLASGGKSGLVKGSWDMLKKNYGRITTPEPVRNAMGDVLLSRFQPLEMQALLKAQEEIRRLRAASSVSSGVAAGKAVSGIPGSFNR